MKIKKEKINKNVRMYLAFYQGGGGKKGRYPLHAYQNCVVKLIDLLLVKVKPDVLSLI